MGAPIDLEGERFGRLTVVALAPSRATPSGSVKRYWYCSCDCGVSVVVSSGGLRSGGSQSCGCFHRERASAGSLTHGHSVETKRSPTYRTWQAMLTRCTNPRQKGWKNYGGRGIHVCARWSESFEAFLADMGDRGEGMTIERIDNEMGYEPGNCRWAVKDEQQRNSRANRLVTAFGETAILAEWAEWTGIPSGRIRRRLELGWTPEAAVSVRSEAA